MGETVGYVTFGRGGNADGCIGKGWSPGEEGFRWMIDDISEFWIDCAIKNAAILRLDLHPLVGAPSRPSQRVVILINDIEVHRADLAGWACCDIPIPPDALKDESRLRVTVQHPDAISPQDLNGTDDHRRLAFAIREARLYPASVAEHAASDSIGAPAVIVDPARLNTVFVGNCQMSALSALYRDLVSESGDHDVTYVPSYNDLAEPTRSAIANATVVVQQILDFVPRIGAITTRAKIHFVPHASAAFLWPYALTPHPRNRPEPTIEQSGPYNAELGDSFLNRKILDGTPPAAAVSEYLAAETAVTRRADRMMELHLQKQRDRDAACDIQVADRIEKLFQTTPLFRSPSHPVPQMAAWLASEVFARIGAPADSIDRLVANPPDRLPATETPMHPALVSHFGITYAPPSRRYRFFDEGGFTFTEYAERYMCYEWNVSLAEGIHLLRQKQTDLAIIKLEEALPTAPRSIIGRMALVEALSQRGRPKDAIEYACEAAAIEPDNEAVVTRLWQIADSLRV